MADNNQRKVNSSLELLRRQVGDLYTSTYYTQDNSEEMKNQVSDRLDDAIRKSTQNDDEFKNISTTSRLFRKLLKDDGNAASKKLDKAFGNGSEEDISNLFQNPEVIASLMSSYSKTKWITELDNEFDLICKYMTKLQAALDIKRDAVLCSDSYTKEFLNITAKGENPSSEKSATIQNNIDEMKKKYDLSAKAESWYEDTSKYGEAFVYCVPYDIALDQLLKRKKNTSYSLTEASITQKDLKNYLPKNASGSANIELSESGDPIIRIKLDTSKVIEEAVQNNLFLRKAAGDDKLKGLSEYWELDCFQE